MRRRYYLASTAALLAGPLAGCAHSNTVLQMDETSDAEIAHDASRNLDGHPGAGSIVAEAVESGSTNAIGRSKPFDTDEPIEHRGRYYEFTVTETGQRETTVYSISIDYDPGTETRGGTTIDHDDLPDVDRETIGALLPPVEGSPGDDGFGVSREFSEAELEQSVLVPDQEYDAVVHDGERYPIDVGDGRTVTVSDYHYEAEEIATDAAEFGASVRETYAFTLSGLSAAEREIVEEAIDGGYYEGSPDDAFESLARRFREHEGIRTDEWGGEWLARYGGTVYWVDLEHPPSAVEG